MTFFSVARRFGVLALGVIGVVVGVVLLLPRPTPSSFGWTAYAPLANTTFVPQYVTGSLVLSTVLVLVGLALTAGWIGFALGRRMKRRGIPQ